MMNWLDELDYPVLQVETKTIINHIDDICCSYQKSEEIYDALATTIPENVLNFTGLAWQYDHQSHQYKGERKMVYQNESQFYREIAASLLEEKTDEAVITKVFDTFDDMNRTSSLIEMVNSLIRPYAPISDFLIRLWRMQQFIGILMALNI